ncbi:MAG: hypothetical protein QNJ72_05485 [Pleurocapsa sp. MO_226.B13]|nr:hypothetical protein [Pleurocapsa sp. MO_226.B13]
MAVLPYYLLSVHQHQQLIREVMNQTKKKAKLNFGFIAELNVSEQPIEIKLEKIANETSLLKGTISTQESIKLKNLVNALEKELGDSIPDDIEIALNELLLIIRQKDKKTQYLISLNLGTEINLSSLPLIGKEFASDRTIAIKNFKLLYASAKFNKIAGILEQQDIDRGLGLSASMQFGDRLETLDIPITKSDRQEDSSNSKNKNNSNVLLAKTSIETTETTSPQKSETTKWFDLKKNFGPVYFKRVGVQYQNSEVWFLLDASISSAGLTLTLDGLSVGSSIKQFKPKFNLHGIGIDYESEGAVSIGGSFLRTTIDGKDEYSGTVIVKTEAFTLFAFGSYTTTEGHPSLFIYGVLDKPIGGPPFFFVTGLALGFAYNRSLILPTLDDIPNFPLVQAALSGAQANVDELIGIQQDLRPYIPPKVGQVVLMVGIKFTSFKLIESFVLLVATFGDRFALDLLGISTLISPPIPPGVNPDTLPPPLAQVRFAILASFVPSEGTLKVEGKILPDSYLFDRNCHLSGGFAFYSWFSGRYQDDFVLTVGGYHPSFQIPAHYPRVDPLALNWRISNQLSVKGSMYFALTASAIMAGGSLEAVWQSGSIKAWFIAKAHFIVAWKPYFYDARISLSLGASYTFKIFGWRKTIKVQVGASLHIWGPQFSGTATINLSVVSFTIRFGDRSGQKPKPIKWSEFKTSFLPADNKICTIDVASGLLRKLETANQEEIFIVNPQEFAFTATSIIPLKDAETGQILIKQQTESGITPETSFGVAPMNVNNQKFTESKYSISLVKIQADGREKSQGSNFECIPIAKNIPTGLWGESNSNNPNQPRLIDNVLSGYKIKPANPPTPGEPQAIERKNLAYDTQPVSNAYQWNSFATFSASEETDEDIRERNIAQSITSEAVKNARHSLQQSLGLSDIEIDLEEFTTDKGIEQAFIIAPQLEAAII